MELITIENIAGVTERLDRVRIAAQKLADKLAEATEMFASGEIREDRFQRITEPTGTTLGILNRALKIILSAATAKQKLNSGKGHVAKG